jgi:hypothetical protein
MDILSNTWTTRCCLPRLGNQGLEQIMKIRQVQDENNQHIVAVEKDGEMRCFFRWHTLAAASLAYQNLLRDIARHGEEVVKFDALLPITFRISKRSGKKIYMVNG